MLLNNNSKKIFLSSFSSFIIAYVITIISNHILTSFLAADNNIESHIFFTYIIINMPSVISNEVEDIIITLNLIVPFISFIIGLILLFIYISKTQKSITSSHILLWFIIIILNNTFGTIISGCAFNMPITQIANIMHFDITIKIIIAGVSMFLLVKISTLLGDSIISKDILIIHDKQKQKISYLLLTLVFPALSGYFLILILRNNEKILEFNLSFLTLAIMLASSFLANTSHEIITKNTPHINNKHIIVTTIFSIITFFIYYHYTNVGISISFFY